MKVLMISTDRLAFEAGSAVQKRLAMYGAHVDELHVVVCATKAHRLQKQTIGSQKNVSLYPTNTLTRWLYPFSAYRTARRVIENWKLKIDELRNNCIITSQDPFETGLAGMWLSKTLGCPLEVQVHTDLYSPYFKRLGTLNRIRLAIAQKTLKAATCIRVVSNRIRESLLTHFPQEDMNARISVLPIHVASKADTEQKYLSPEALGDFDMRALIVSRLEPEKGVGIALEAFAEVLKAHPRTGLFIVGDGSQRARLEQYAHTLGLDDHVRFCGRVNDATPYYHAVDVYVQTSHFEGYGMSLVEAALTGLPLVATNTGIAPDLLEEVPQYLCQPGDSECIARGLRTLLEDANARRAAARSAQKQLNKVTHESEAAYVKSITDQWHSCGNV